MGKRRRPRWKRRAQPTTPVSFSHKRLRRTKTVRFADPLEQVLILPLYECILDEHAGLDDDIEGDTSQPRTASSVTRPTSEFTLLSSVHGRARRELREISRLDLQSAVKYGVKTPGAPCRKTGEPRWVYTYGNLVYVTDKTSKKEITSYHQPIVIQEAPITPEMTAQHDEDMKILLEDPHLCVSHIFIVIDQSGSMRTSDVHGFRNRSQAAYGMLILDYISDQLLQREGGGDKVLEAVTVVEMRSDSPILCHREPLDWILFNKLLRRQQGSDPCYHGDYNNALLSCKSLIFQELREMDPEDAPIYAMIFLSDGRPSDCSPKHSTGRQIILMDIANELKSNFELHTIGIGKSSADFSSLKAMTTWVRDCGCKATFHYSQLSSAQLGGAFSSISSSMTATRTEALSGNGATSVPRQKKDVKLRSKTISLNERIYRMETRWNYHGGPIWRSRKDN